MKYHFKIFAVIHGFYFSAPHISVKPDILDSLLLLKQPWQGILRNLTDFEWSYRKKFNFFYTRYSINFDLSWLTPTDQFPTPNLKSTLNTALLLPHYQNDSLSKTHTHITGRNKRKKNQSTFKIHMTWRFVCNRSSACGKWSLMKNKDKSTAIRQETFSYHQWNKNFLE